MNHKIAKTPERSVNPLLTDACRRSTKLVKNLQLQLNVNSVFDGHFKNFRVRRFQLQTKKSFTPTHQPFLDNRYDTDTQAEHVATTE